MDISFTAYANQMIADNDRRRDTENSADHRELFCKGRPVHVAAARVLDRYRDDDCSAPSLTLRERKVLPLVIESEIERLMPGRERRNG